MKHLSLLLGITLGCVAPLAVQAEQTALIADTTAPQAKAKKNTVVVTAPAPAKKPKVWYEVTNLTAVGSHLPVVVCHRGDLMYVMGSFHPGKAYRRSGSGLDTTGAANVAGELISLDPAFSAGSGLH